MKALIVEDKGYIRKGLINLLETVETNVEIIGECASVNEAVVVSNACKPELIFLDINLTDGTGFDFLDQTEHLCFKTIFITAYEEYALKALKAGAVDYLLKPVDMEELDAALRKVKPCLLRNKNSKYIRQKKFGTKMKLLWFFLSAIVFRSSTYMNYCTANPIRGIRHSIWPMIKNMWPPSH